jgi:hypothetical protein
MSHTITTSTGERIVVVDFGATELSGSLHHDDAHRVLELLHDEGVERISVDLGPYGHAPGPGRVFIKDWSEHRGLAERMRASGLVRIVRSVRVGPFASLAHEVEVTL